MSFRFISLGQSLQPIVWSSQLDSCFSIQMNLKSFLQNMHFILTLSILLLKGDYWVQNGQFRQQGHLSTFQILFAALLIYTTHCPQNNFLHLANLHQSASFANLQQTQHLRLSSFSMRRIKQMIMLIVRIYIGFDIQLFQIVQIISQTDMKNTNPTVNPMDKIYEVISNETRKFQIRRKMSANHEKRHQSADNLNFVMENLKEKSSIKPNQHSFLEEQPKDTPQERATSKQNKNAVRLPNINTKKTAVNLQKQNELARIQTNLYRIQGKKVNMEQWNTETKAKTTQSIDDIASKFLNVRPLKYEKSPLLTPDTGIKSLKSVKNKYPLKSQSQKEGVFCEEGQEMASQKVSGERKLKTVNKRIKKDYSVSKNEGQDTLMRRQKKQVKSSSISQTVQVVGKRKYSINYLDFCLFVSLLNRYNGLHTSNATYKAFVGKGNNSILIKNTLKNRFWWNISQNQAQANLYWLQSRDNKFIQLLKSFNKNSQKPIEQARHKFFLQKPKEVKENEKLDVIKEFTKTGFLKLMSEVQAKQLCKSPFQSEIVVDSSFNTADCANKFKLHNHFEFNWNITNKKALYYNLKRFYLATKQDPFQFIPLTFHIQVQGDAEWQRFQEHFNQKQQFINQKTQGKNKKKKEKNLWIIKPGENSNQGCGIQVAETIEQIKQIIKSKQNLPNGRKRSHIIQRYLMPLLYNKRKFDIRCYIVVTSFNQIVKAYWYEQGYIRTSSKEFTLKNLKNRFIHLTNDAVQKKSQDYGKYQNGNKVSFSDFEKYLEANFQDKDYSFYSNVYPKMMRLAADAIRSVHSLLDSCNREYTFQIFGLDFMIDEEFNTWLIEVNNNPCLELGCPLLARIIPNMIQNAFKIAVDPLFPPPREYPKSKMMPTELFESNKFTLIFNGLEEKEKLKDYLKVVDPKNLSNIIESDEEEDSHEDFA